MHDHRPKPSSVAAAFIVPTLLILVGAGCFSMGEKLADDAVTPITVPVQALKQSKEELEAAQAKQNETAEMASDDMTVAMILTDGSVAPADTLLGDAVGCNDRIAFAKVHRGAATDSVLHDALITLFSVKDTNYNSLLNALGNSTLAVDKIQSNDGVTTEVWLKGSLVSGGACDDPRLKGQIEHTIKRFKPKYKIFLNGNETNWRCFGDMSGECK